jgi:hypothetical protein
VPSLLQDVDIESLERDNDMHITSLSEKIGLLKSVSRRPAACALAARSPRAC